MSRSTDGNALRICRTVAVFTSHKYVSPKSLSSSSLKEGSAPIVISSFPQHFELDLIGLYCRILAYHRNDLGSAPCVQNDRTRGIGYVLKIHQLGGDAPAGDQFRDERLVLAPGGGDGLGRGGSLGDPETDHEGTLPRGLRKHVRRHPLRGPLASPLYLGEASLLADEIGAHLRDLRESLDDANEIVGVVGDATCKLADCLHFLRLTKFRLERLQLGHILRYVNCLPSFD